MMPFPIVPLIAQSTILPAWAVVPIAALTMLVIAAHILAMHEVEMPARRRRIRTANGLIMMFITGLLAYALSLTPVREATPLSQGEARTFVQVWLIIIVLVGMVVLLAGLDALETLRLSTRNRREMRSRLRANLKDIIAERRRMRSGHAGRGNDSH